MAKSKSDVLVVGAGLAGLNAAISCTAAGLDVKVIESSERPGGRVATDLVNGFICDRGFQLINSKYPALVDLDVIDEIDFIKAPRVIEVSLGNTRHALGDPRVAPWTALDRATGTVPEKLALLLFLFRGAKEGQSLGQLLRKCGSTYARVLRPFLTGVFLADPDEIDAGYGYSIIKSFINGAPGVPRKGVAQLPLALAKRIEPIDYNTHVYSLDGQTVHTSQGAYWAKNIIVATDFLYAKNLLGFSESADMVGCVTWYHATSNNPSGNGRLVVDGQKRGPIYNSVVMSDISPDYAPAGQHLVSTTTGLGATEAEVGKHLSLVWGQPTHDWSAVARYEIPAALHLQGINRPLTQKIKIDDHLFVVGDHRSVPSQQGALFTGRLAAELILN